MKESQIIKKATIETNTNGKKIYGIGGRRGRKMERAWEAVRKVEGGGGRKNYRFWQAENCRF